MTATKKPQLNPFLKLALDLGPLALFFFANTRYGIFVATATFMVAVLAALAVSFAMTRQLPIMPVVTAIIVVVFGGLIFKKPLLGVVFDSIFELTDEGWRKLTLRWAFFFLVLAVLNEIVWRNTSTNVWVDFKVFGVTPLTLIFGALQVPLLKRYAVEPAE